MKKDLRDALQSFEVDENECILEYEPKNKKGKRSGLAPLSNTAILSLCLMTGLSAGIGSALIGNVRAETKLEVPAEIPMVDEPLAKPEAEVEIQLPAQPKEIEEVIPNRPPLDQPVAGEVEAQISKEEKEEKGERAEKKEKKQSLVKNQYNSVSQAKAPTTPANSNSRKIESAHAASSKPQSTGHDSSKQNPAKTGPSQQTQLAAGPKAQPKTEQGGKLPDTAGNDLNGALLGGAVASLGALYFGKRRKAEQE